MRLGWEAIESLVSRNLDGVFSDDVDLIAYLTLLCNESSLFVSGKIPSQASKHVRPRRVVFCRSDPKPHRDTY
jgi:hypothetical protein